MSIESRALSCLLMKNVFAPSVSALAKEITSCGRNTLYRVRDGVAGDDSVAVVWRELMRKHRLNDNDLYLLYAIFDSFHTFLPEYKKHCKIEDNACRATSFIALCKEDYERFSEDFNRGVLQELLQLKSNDPIVYYGNLVLFYIYASKIDYNAKDFVNNFRKYLQGLCATFEDNYPTELTSKEIAGELLEYDFANHLHPCLFTMFIYGMRVVRSYLDADFLDEFLKLGILFNVGEFSCWHATGKPYGNGAVLWFFEENSSSSPFNGSYRVSRLVMGKTVGSYSVEEHFVFFFKPSCSDGCQLPMVEITSFGCMKYYQASYEFDRNNLVLRFLFDRGDENVCGLPCELRLVNVKSPVGKEEKVWARVVNDFISNGSIAIRNAFDNEVLLKDFEDVSKDYRIDDVVMNRKDFSIYLTGTTGCSCYTLCNEDFDFIANINALSEIVILRHRASDELFFLWSGVGKYLPFSAFEVKKVG